MKKNRENSITKQIICWKKTKPMLLLLLGTLIFFPACSAHQGIVVQRPNEEPQVFSGDKNQLPSGTEEFVIGHGDVLRVETLPSKTLRKPFVLDTENLLYIRFYFGRSEYRLMVGDELRVNFLADSKNNFDAVVRFDAEAILVSRQPVGPVGAPESGGPASPVAPPYHPEEEARPSMEITGPSWRACVGPSSGVTARCGGWSSCR